MTSNGKVVSALAEERGTAGHSRPRQERISCRLRNKKRSRELGSEEMTVTTYPIEIRPTGQKFKLQVGTYYTLEDAKVARDCATYVELQQTAADYVPKEHGYNFPEIPSICKSWTNWERLCHDFRKVCAEGSFSVERGNETKREHCWVSSDIRELVEVVISTRAANGNRQPASDVETAVPSQSSKQVTETLDTTKNTSMAVQSEYYASKDVEVVDVVYVCEHQSDGKLSGPLNYCAPQAIAERVKEFTFEQCKVLLQNLPDVVQQHFRSVLLPSDSSEAAVNIPHAAAPQVNDSQRTDNVLAAGGRSQSPETLDAVAAYGRATSTITSSQGRGNDVQELETLSERAPTNGGELPTTHTEPEWLTSADLRTEPIRHQGPNLIMYEYLACPVDASQDNREPSVHNVNNADNHSFYNPTSSHTVPTASRPACRYPSVEEEETNRELCQGQKPPADDSDIEIVRDRTDEAPQEGSGGGVCNDFDDVDQLFNDLPTPTPLELSSFSAWMSDVTFEFSE